MFTRSTLTIYRKELKDILRDRRTVISMTVIPILLIPLLIIGMSAFTIGAIKSISKKTSMVLWLRNEGLELKQKTSQLPGMQIIDTVYDSLTAVEMLRDKTIDAVVIVPSEFESIVNKVISGNESILIPEIVVLEDQTREKSKMASRKVFGLISDFRTDLVALALRERGMRPEFVKPFSISQQNVKSSEEMVRFGAGMFLPYFMILMLMSGAMYPAIDLTAGEKERGTLETLLVSGVSRADIVMGKFLTVLTAGLLTLVLSIFSMVITLTQGIKLSPEIAAAISKEFSFSFDIGSAIPIIAALLPLAIIFSALLMVIALFAKSFREAQSYISPLMIVVILPAMASMMPGVELNLQTALVPILNVSLILKQSFAGLTDTGLFTVVIIENITLSAICLWLVFMMFRRESVLFRV